MALVRWQPNRMLSRLQQMFDETLPDWDMERVSLGTWNPRVDMYEKGDNLVVEAELPGVKKEDIDVRVEDHHLTLRGEYKEEKEAKEEDYYRHERRQGKFTRSLALPSTVAADKVDATFKDGILRVTLPKTVEAKGKRVAVK